MPLAELSHRIQSEIDFITATSVQVGDSFAIKPDGKTNITLTSPNYPSKKLHAIFNQGKLIHLGNACYSYTITLTDQPQPLRKINGYQPPITQITSIITRHFDGFDVALTPKIQPDGSIIISSNHPTHS